MQHRAFTGIPFPPSRCTEVTPEANQSEASSRAVVEDGDGPRAANAWGCMDDDRPRRLNSSKGPPAGSLPPTRSPFVHWSYGPLREGVVEQAHLVGERVGRGASDGAPVVFAAATCWRACQKVGKRHVAPQRLLECRGHLCLQP